MTDKKKSQSKTAPEPIDEEGTNFAVGIRVGFAGERQDMQVVKHNRPNTITAVVEVYTPTNDQEEGTVTARITGMEPTDDLDTIHENIVGYFAGLTNILADQGIREGFTVVEKKDEDTP